MRNTAEQTSSAPGVIDRAAQLLALVVRAERGPTFTQLVAETGMTKATVSRTMAALERNDLVERTEEGTFRGGALFVEYAARFDRTEALIAQARPLMQTLMQRTGETVHLAVALGDTVTIVEQVDGPHIVGAVSWVGYDVPPHCSALGKVLIAWGVVRFPFGRLSMPTSQTISTHAELREHLEACRDRGWATTLSELEEDLDGIAVPVRGTGDRVVAALGVSGPTYRFGDRLEEVADLLGSAADDLHRALVRQSRRTIR
ncbi:IclR family transcriptional regulator [Nocardioides sp. CFH 31398]|uniref:IclR family transcriptional regulator n=1 Tax=Nocardioides sp. CFH 31398 TaxID=2919579 RepID=UPI001F057B0A|nr:IclR family transcriptional regulator [Nocardioides sp. CFH 31398]MCH1866054.1 IclR family transcriptional regulator [Nocardioides sp. CFH 31398]